MIIIQELKQLAQNVSFDVQPMPKLSSEAIDFRAASEQFRELRKLKLKDYENTISLPTFNSS